MSDVPLYRIVNLLQGLLETRDGYRIRHLEERMHTTVCKSDFKCKP